MNPKISVYIATSLDGFIARKNGDIDWLDAAVTIPAGEDCGYYSFFKDVDAMVMGRHTYEKVLSFGKDKWHYGDTPVIVMSSQPITFVPEWPGNLHHSSETPLALCERLNGEGIKHVYVDGGITIGRFLSEGLVDEMTISLIPIILGDGIPLFDRLEADIPLKCLRTTIFECGLVQIKYQIVKAVI